jgi:ATP-binding cassette, subfamily B, bacterial
MSKNFNRIAPYFKDKKIDLFILIVLVIISTVLVVISPLAISYIIDNFIIKGSYQGMDKYLFILLGIYIIQMFVSYLSTSRVGHLAQAVMYELRGKVFGKIQEFPLNFFLANQSGDIISRVNNDTRKIDNLLSRYIFEFISSFFTFLGIGLFIFTQNVILALCTWAFVIILIVFSRLVGPMVASASKEQLESNAKIATFLNENITNYKAVVVFNQQKTIGQDFNNIAHVNYSKTLKSKILSGMFRPLYNFAGLISQALVATVGIYLVGAGLTTAGTLVAFILYTAQFYQPINRLAAVYGSFEQAVGAWDRINEVFDLDPNNPNQQLTVSDDHKSQDIDL